MKNATFLKIASLFIFLLSAQSSFGQEQLLYSENFTGQLNVGIDGPAGNAIDPSAAGVTWTMDVTDCTFSAYYEHFKVIIGGGGSSNERLQANDTDGEAIWYSPSINISSYNSVRFNFNAYAEGTNTGYHESSDYIKTYYSIDGGSSWTQVETNGDINDDFGALTPSQTGLSGSTLQIKVVMKNDSWGEEWLSMDNLEVYGTSTQTHAEPEFFLEDFSGQDGKGVSGSGSDFSGVNWTMDVSDCTLNGGDYFKVANSNPRLKAKDVDGDAIWYSESVDISCYTDVSFFIYAKIDPQMESSDFIKIEYRLDDTGDWIQAQTNGYLPGTGSEVYYNSEQFGLNGTSLQLKVTINVDDKQETPWVDNMKVYGTAIPAPTAYAVSADDDALCSGDDAIITVADSETGVNYQLKKDGANEGAAIAGTGSAIEFTGITTAGTYTVVATGSCATSSDMSGSVTITTTVTPSQRTVTTNDNALCSEEDATITVAASESGVSYQLKKDGVNEGTAIAGTGNAIDFPTITTAGTYTVVASNSCGTLTMSTTVTITTTVTPTSYQVFADTTSLCPGQQATITVADSETGVSYQLLLDNSAVTGAVAQGTTGSAVTFTGITTAGTYTVVATKGNCSATMTGSVTITTATAPVANFTASATTIEVGQNVTFTDNSSGSPTSWSWDFDGDGSEDSIDQNPTYTFNTAGSYTVTLTPTNSCGSDTETKVDYITVTVAAVNIAIQNFDGATPSWSYTDAILGSATVNLFFEDLTGESDGDTTGSASGINWALSGGGGSTSELYVHGGSGDHVHMSKNDGTIAVWETTDNINIANYANLNFTVKVRKTENLDNDDYVKLLYSKNGGAPIEIETYYDDMDNGTIIGGDINSLTGNTLIGNPGDTIKLFMHVSNNDSDEQFEWEEIKLTGIELVDGDGTISPLGDNTTTAWGNSGATAVAQITFDTIDTSYGENLTFSFDYFIDSETESSGPYEDNFVYNIYYNGSETASASEELIVNGGARDTWTSKSVSVPDGTTSVKVIFNYDVTDASNEHLGLDNLKIKGIIDCSLANNNVTSVGATNDDSQASISWNPPPTGPCFTIDEYLVIAKQGSAVATSPSGDGSAYADSATFGFGSAFDGGFVVYKGAAETATVTSLVNFVTYHATLFTRSGTTWSSGETIQVTPSVSENLFYEDFQDELEEIHLVLTM
jgi:PKD repeat protein